MDNPYLTLFRHFEPYDPFAPGALDRYEPQSAQRLPELPAEVLASHEVAAVVYAEARERGGLGAFAGVQVAREMLVLQYAWAVPSPEALEVIREHAPGGVVEIGAGTGYWAHMLTQAGVDVLAYDLEPGGNSQVGPVQWHPVRQGGTEAAALHPERTLLLSWPPRGEAMALDALNAYQGDTVIYVGEWGGCTGSAAFHEALATEWTILGALTIPRWPMMKDKLYVLRRGADQEMLAMVERHLDIFRSEQLGPQLSPLSSGAADYGLE